MAIEDGVLRLDLGPWEISTVQLRRDEGDLLTADVSEAVGPRLSR
jgi:hypothetical protein